jgi:superfamily II DNA/RNA helicase
MRLRLEGNETRDELLETLSHVGATHQASTNTHLRKMLIDEADELLDAVAFIDQFEAMTNG